MLTRLLRSRQRQTPETAYALYGAIVAQARQPAFYASLGVPDTPEGRFDMLVVHAVLLFHRLRTDGAAGQALGQEVFDLFFRDMDRSLREMGVGDLGVPKRMKAMVQGFYGRSAAYLEALAAGDPARFGEAVDRNVFAVAPRPADAAAIGRYAVAAAAALANQPGDAIAAGGLAFPSPDPYIPAR